MKILVTGAGGYLGSHLIQMLSNSNFQVTGVTTNPNLNKTFKGNFELKKIEWQDKKSLLNLCSNQELVIHAAGMNYQSCESRPQEARKFNGEATANLIDAAITKSVKKFIYISTVHVYSDSLEGEFNELSPTQATNSYATSHLLGEQEVLSRIRGRLISGKVVRAGNIFGRPELLGSQKSNYIFINELCKSIVEEKQFIVTSNPNIERDFVPIDFFLEQFKKILINIMKIDQEIINLVTSQSFSLNEIANLIRNIYAKVYMHKKEPIIIYKSEIKKVKPLHIWNTSGLISNPVSNEVFENQIKDLIKYFEDITLDVS